MDPIFKQVPIFAGMDDASLEFIAQHSKEHVFPAHEVIVREGEQGHQIFIIAKGSVRVVKNYCSINELDLAVLNDTDFFGEICLFYTAHRTATVEANIETRAFTIRPLAFHSLGQKMPQQYAILLLNIARDMARRLRNIDEVYAATHG
ncbi:MAG: cyclic nucleotide-binding domain-containing protein [Verrucomicrobiae bacterium]|nr:cyclic nucleotide-binding domain-containing protein [Verrucomicrobiae bacterium]